MSLGGERYKVEGGVTRGSHTCKKFAGRMWPREHYASEISDMNKSAHIKAGSKVLITLKKKKPISPNLTCGRAVVRE